MTTDPNAQVRAAVSATFHDEWGRIVASLIGMTGDWNLAEECAQDAFTRALQTWERSGVPSRPGAWILTAARNRAIDVMRRRAKEAVKLQEAAILRSPGPGAADLGDVDDSDIPDERLRLIFTCCHPALPMGGRVALTLRTLTGLTTAEIARALLLSETATAARIARAKQKIRNAGIPYRVPPAKLLPERTAGVLYVLYLLFNEGYSASSGPDLLRPDLCLEAIRLARLLTRLMPDEPEASGLLALMLLQDSRRAARIDGRGDLITLEQQDRARWDQAQIREGHVTLQAALQAGRPGPYQLQASIADQHASAAQADRTDWQAIAVLYGQLARLAPSPVVELNRAVAVGMAQGPAAGLKLLDSLATDGTLGDYHRLPAARADLLRRLGRHDEAAQAYREAVGLTSNTAERRYLTDRIAELTGTER